MRVTQRNLAAESLLPALLLLALLLPARPSRPSVLQAVIRQEIEEQIREELVALLRDALRSLRERLV